MEQLVILLVINCSSTCFGRLYACRQEGRLRCDVGESGGKLCGVGCLTQATYSTQCTQLASRLSNITIVTSGQKTIGSETQSDLLTMGVKTHETC
jgi:hypothetical protein